MKIFNKDISDKAALIICDIMEKSKRKIIFKENTGGKCFVDVNDPKIYTIEISLKFAGAFFEVCILHELLHTVQIDEGFPVIYFDDEDERIDNGIRFIINKLDSLVKDIFVNRDLLSLGFEMITTPVKSFERWYNNLVSQNEKTVHSKNCMVMCLIANKYVYNVSVEELEKSMTDDSLKNIYECISKVIEENIENSYYSMKNIYDIFFEMFQYPETIYANYEG